MKAEGIETTLSVYPNPAKDKLFLDGFFVGDTYRIFNIDGSLVQMDLVSNCIDISNLNSGIYFLSIHNVDSKIEMFRLVVNE